MNYEFDTKADSRLDFEIRTENGKSTAYLGQGGRVIMFNVDEWKAIQFWINNQIYIYEAMKNEGHN